MADVPNGPVPVPKIDLEAIIGLLKTSGWKDKRLWALLMYPVLVVLNNKYGLGLTAGQLEYFGIGLAAYIVTSGSKAAVLGMQFLKWFHQGGAPEVVSSPPAEKKRKSGVVGAVVSSSLLVVALGIALLPVQASAQRRATLFGGEPGVGQRSAALTDNSVPATTLDVPPLTSVLAPAYLLGVGVGVKGVSPTIMLGGTLALGNLFERPVSLFAGGGILATVQGTDAEAVVKPAGTLGLTWALTSGGQNEAAMGVYGSYVPGSGSAAGGWAFGLAIVVSNLFSVGGGGG